MAARGRGGRGRDQDPRPVAQEGRRRELTAPRAPIRRGGPAPPLPGGFELTVDTFVVEELPLYAPSGGGAHTWAWIEKRGLSTLFLVERLAAALGCEQRAIGYAGLKDRHATARQWLSVEGDRGDALRGLELEGVAVLDVTRHDNKLKLGQLRGNRFEVELAGDPARADDLRANLDDLARRGVPNWFGAQRFGSGGRNLEKGLSILRGDPRRAGRRFRKPLLRLLLSAVQSEAFNRVLAARLETTDRLEDGDVAWLHHNGACFAVADALAEQPRCDRFEISPTGPLPGPKCLAAGGAQGELEAAVLAELGVAAEQFAPFKSNRGERRPLRCRLREPRVEAAEGRVRIGFELDRGSFATMVLNELVAEAPWV